MFKRLLLFLVVLLIYDPLLAQNNKISHSINLTGGTTFIYNQVAFHYELLEERRYVHTFIQGGLSLGYNLWSEESITTPFARLGFLAERIPIILRQARVLVCTYGRMMVRYCCHRQLWVIGTLIWMVVVLFALA